MTRDYITVLIGVLGLLMVGSFALYHYGAHREAKGYERANAENNAVALAANASNQVKAAELKNQLKKAVEDAKEREKILAADAGHARAESERLRVSLKASRDKLSRATADAVRKYAATLGELFGECGSEVERLAREAGGHASDSLMYQEGWPK